MRAVLGVDTGGTYTDAALVDHETGEVLAGAKALTTRHDLSIGIKR
ncbi:MAG: hydantoinase/oxoprolinase N-terminal domain-containing protein, partial [Anaerolineae bacterium]